MPTLNYLHEFSVGPVPASVLDVRRVSLIEACSCPYRLRVVADYDGRLPIKELLNAPAVLEVKAETDLFSTTVRLVHGSVLRAKERLVRSNEALQRITFEVAPPMAWLRLTRDSRVFLRRTTQQIVQEVFQQCGLPTDCLEFRLKETYLPREVCTQYEETSFDFVSRLLEEEGICYFFEHSDAGVKMICADSPEGFSKHPSGSLPLIPPTGGSVGESVHRITPFRQLRPAKVVLRDHDFRHADLVLEAESSDEAPLGIEHYEYPGRFTDEETGKRFAKVRLEEQASLAEGVHGTAQAFSMLPGHVFRVTADPGAFATEFSTAGSNGWVPVFVSHHWQQLESGQISYQTRFSARSAELAYRPERRTPKGQVKGPMLATVTTAPGEEIECDDLGCVTVQYLWDRYGKQNDESSGKVRVLQMQSTGSVAIPRKGWEVVVECEDGDPDKPIIVGRLYNSAQPPPASLPADKTVTALQSFTSPGGGGHNEIRINDGAGGELISVHAQKDMNVTVANDRKLHVTNNCSVGVGAKGELTVGVGRTEEVKANDSLVVGATLDWTVGAVRSETVTRDSKLEIAGKRTSTIGVSDTTMTPMAIATSTSGNLSETVGGLCLEAAALEASTAVAGSCTEMIGGAKIEAVGGGKSETTLGARTSLVGGAYINASGKDVSLASKGSKNTLVGGMMVAAGGKTVDLSGTTELKITIGGALAALGKTIVLKVGNSNITLSSGTAVVSAKKITLEATGPNAELSPLVSSK